MNNRLRFFLICGFVLLLALPAESQIFPPEGMNMPGAYNGFAQPPTALAFAGVQVTGGRFLLDSSFLPIGRRYSTTIKVDTSASADAHPGKYNWLFTSGPTSNYYQNKWNPTTVTPDVIQSYGYQGGSVDDTVTLVDSVYYTVNFRDNGYAASSAIWITTATAPVSIVSVTQSPTGPTVAASTPVTVTMNLNVGKPPSQNLYLRYSTDNFASSTLVAGAEVGAVQTEFTATIPGQVAGTQVKYYAFTSKVMNPTTDLDLVTLRENTNNGTMYSYNIPSAMLTINASAGPHGTINPSGAVSVTSGNNQTFTFTPDSGYYVDSIIVDNAFAGDSASYTFVNVMTNHTIVVKFAHNVNVTFQVNMAQQIRVGAFKPDSGDIVSVNGTFNGFTPAVDTLTVLPGDSVWRKTKSLKANTQIQYKFWKSFRAGHSWEDDIANRVYNIPDTASKIAVVYFDNQRPPAPPVNVTFQVNMSFQMIEGNFRLDSGDVVLVRGSFNGFGTGDTLTDPNHDSIYTKTISIPGSQVIEYKFWKTLRGGLDWENDIANRVDTIASSDQLLAPVFFDNQSDLTTILSVNSAWNMISLPRVVSDPRKTTLFPTAVSNAFAYNGSYQIKDSLLVGVGYWLKFPAAHSDTIKGAPVNLDSVAVVDGWNMIGSLAKPIATASITSSPSGIVLTNYFGYSAGYVIVDSIMPGQAYWIKVSQAGHLIMSSSSASPNVAARSDGALRQLNSLTVRDAAGRTQTLYLGLKVDGAILQKYELPPAPPNGAFDVRFESNRLVESALPGQAQDYPLALSSLKYPVTVSWSMLAGATPFKLRLDGKEIVMVGTGSARIASQPSNISILYPGASEIPTVFALEQNYPNPFNPTTMITYALPVNARVTLKVYNALGQEVATLVDGVEEAGMKSVQWAGTNRNGAGLASGIYFYSLHATGTADPGRSFSSVKKMLLIK